MENKLHKLILEYYNNTYSQYGRFIQIIGLYESENIRCTMKYVTHNNEEIVNVFYVTYSDLIGYMYNKFNLAINRLEELSGA